MGRPHKTTAGEIVRCVEAAINAKSVYSAAVDLGVNPSTLYNWVDRYGEIVTYSGDPIQEIEEKRRHQVASMSGKPKRRYINLTEIGLDGMSAFERIEGVLKKRGAKIGSLVSKKISKSIVDVLESQKKATIKTIRKVAKRLGTSEDYILSGGDVKDKENIAVVNIQDIENKINSLGAPESLSPETKKIELLGSRLNELEANQVRLSTLVMRLVERVQ